jgi:deazaflavin-dependent oxidoreductase (nitroreductase family)
MMDANAQARPGRLADRQTVTLTHYGRKSGKPYKVTIRFVVEGERVYIGSANVNRQWVRNVQKTPHIKLAVGGETFAAEARFVTDRTEHEHAMAAIRRKYWMFSPIIALGRLLTALGVMRENTGSFEVNLNG